MQRRSPIRLRSVDVHLLLQKRRRRSLVVIHHRIRQPRFPSSKTDSACNQKPSSKTHHSQASFHFRLVLYRLPKVDSEHLAPTTTLLTREYFDYNRK
jgi:hypothetical protein